MIAVLGLIGTVLAAVVSNLDKLWLARRAVAQWPSATEAVCSSIDGYPRGMWKMKGVNTRTGDKTAVFGKEIVFDGPTKGTWYQGLGKPLGRTAAQPGAAPDGRRSDGERPR